MNTNPPTATLRILASSDLHLHLRASPYFTPRPKPHSGLAGVARLIETARSGSAHGATILLDNGDALQGSVLAAVLNPWKAPHPIAKIFNALGYDVMGLGNHDFDFSSAYLDRVSSQINAPVISSNFHDPNMAHIQPHALLEKTLKASDGQEYPIKIGVISVLPTKTRKWNQNTLNTSARIEDMSCAVSKTSKLLRNKGADVLVLLAHSGVGDGQATSDDEASALRLARDFDVDAVIAGHTHDVFSSPPSDSAHGTAPLVQPGVNGSHLGVMDVHLKRIENGWKPDAHATHVLENTCEEDPKITALIETEHQAALVHQTQPIGQCTQPLSTAFSMLKTTAATSLLGRALQSATEDYIARSSLPSLPVLTAIGHYASENDLETGSTLDCPDGALTRQHLMQLFPYEDRICFQKMTGQQIKDWLEHSAQMLYAPQESASKTGLLRSGFYAMYFDCIFGISYRIDPASTTSKNRVKDLIWKGKPLDMAAQFWLCMPCFRAYGGGDFPHTGHNDRFHTTPSSIHTALLQLLAQAPFDPTKWTAHSWRIKGDGNSTYHIHIPSSALPQLDHIHELNPKLVSKNKYDRATLQLSI